MIVSADRLHQLYPNLGFDKNSEKLSTIKQSAHNNYQSNSNDIQVVDDFIRTITSKGFSNLHFRRRDYSDRLKKFWSLLIECMIDDPGSIVEVILSHVEKAVPKKANRNNFIIDNAETIFLT